jgi:hypothetical protein
MIGRTDSLIASDPNTRDLDADLRRAQARTIARSRAEVAAAEARINAQEAQAARERAGIRPTLPPRTVSRLRREERRRMIGREAAADLAAYSTAREHGHPGTPTPHPGPTAA